MASIKFPRMFQWCVILIGIRFVFLYFQALGGLATTGVGLIISGIVIISLCILWNKYRKHLGLWRFLSGIEKFYIPEAYGKLLNQEIRDKKASILVVIPKTGNPLVKDLLIDGKSYRTLKLEYNP